MYCRFADFFSAEIIWVVCVWCVFVRSFHPNNLVLITAGHLSRLQLVATGHTIVTCCVKHQPVASEVVRLAHPVIALDSL